MLDPTTQPVDASMKKTSRKPSEAGVTFCHEAPPFVVRSTRPPPTKSKEPTAKAVCGLVVSSPLKVKSAISYCCCQLRPPSFEREMMPTVPPKNSLLPAAHPLERFAKATA